MPTPAGILGQGPTRTPPGKMRACRRGDMQTKPNKSNLTTAVLTFAPTAVTAHINATQANISCMCAAHAMYILQTHIFGQRQLPTTVLHVLLPVGFNKANACNKISLRLHTCSNAISSKGNLLNGTHLCMHSFLGLCACGRMGTFMLTPSLCHLSPLRWDIRG